MKIYSKFIKSIIEDDNPIPCICQNLFDIWLNHADKNLQDYYYKGEQDSFTFEKFLLKTYDEFFSKELPRACVNSLSPFKCASEDTCFIVMDAMSIREGIFLYRALCKKGFTTKISYSLSSIPSDTLSFREKIRSELSVYPKFFPINNHKKVLISGNENYIWSQFPDVMLDKIRVGRTIISDIEEMYEITEKIVFGLIKQTNFKKIIILSDHSYIRSESGFPFSVSEKAKKPLRELFGNSRFIPMRKNSISEHIFPDFVIDCAGYYLVKSRYIWPMAGKYNIYLHGGVSLMECIVPVIEVEK